MLKCRCFYSEKSELCQGYWKKRVNYDNYVKLGVNKSTFLPRTIYCRFYSFDIHFGHLLVFQIKLPYFSVIHFFIWKVVVPHHSRYYLCTTLFDFRFQILLWAENIAYRSFVGEIIHWNNFLLLLLLLLFYCSYYYYFNQYHHHSLWRFKILLDIAIEANFINGEWIGRKLRYAEKWIIKSCFDMHSIKRQLLCQSFKIKIG